jgi:hypothetical protein
MTTTKSKSKMLRQVKLVREGAPGEDVFWIDNDLARIGKRVVDEAGVVWRVAETYNARPFADVDRQIRVWADFAKTLGSH